MTTRSMKVFSAAVLGTALFATTAGAAEITYRRQVMAQLRHIAGIAADSDFTDLGNRIEILRRNGRMHHNVTLTAGKNYVVAGVCDSDCHSIRLSIFDENNNLIDRAGGGDQLVVAVTPRWTGRFKVVLEMTGCREQECHAGLAGFRK